MIEQKSIDKSKWPRGTWDNEPDRVEFKHNGFSCLLCRVDVHGAWCAYVAMPPGHPWHGKNYNDVDVSVHGGLTYSDSCQGEICHVPQQGESDDVWWLGFDFAHSGDLTPAMMKYFSPELRAETMRYDEYHDLSYVRKCCEELADAAHSIVALPV